MKIVVTAPNYNAVLENEAIVDPNNAVPEGNESNNTATVDVTVASAIGWPESPALIQ